MDEKKIIEELQDITESIKVPDNLMPENIMETAQKKKVEEALRKQKRMTKGFASVAAAVFVLLIANMAYTIGHGDKTINTTENMSSNQAFNSSDVASEDTAEADDLMAAGYDEIYKAIKAYDKKNKSNNYYKYMNITTDIVYDESAIATEDMAVNSGASIVEKESVDFSRTNVQTAGIDESDCIKTDGKYIYYMNAANHKLSIYEAKGKEVELVSEVSISGVGSPKEMLLDGNSILVTGSSYRGSEYQFLVAKYDITDRAKPNKIGEFFQEGNSVETRKIGNVLYLVTSKYVGDGYKKGKPETFVPKVCNEVLDYSSIFLPEEIKNLGYTIVTSVNVSTMEKIDSIAVLGLGGTFYMGSDNIYIYMNEYKTEQKTKIRKIKYNEGKLTMGKEGVVPGQVKDLFAVNEYNGYLRIITTSRGYSGGTANNLFVLDDKMDVVGSVEGLAKGERVYAARYQGDIAYFVTYRETDPLFSVDLSDPTNPEVMGELKIPGFSEYLHPYGEGKMLGIGMDDSTENRWNRVVKLSMFDTSNPYDVLEENVMVLEDATDSPAISQYKAVMIDPAKNIFGFATVDYQSKYMPKYRVFRYENSEFKEIITYDLELSDNMDTIRSVYIGNYVYIVSENEIGAVEIPN